MSEFRNLLVKAATAVKDPDTFICKIKNTNTSAVTPYIAFPIRSAYSGIPSITVTIETSTGQSQTLTITGTNLTTKNDTAAFSLGRIDYFSAISMAQDETATVTIYSKTRKFPSFSFCSSASSSSYSKVNARLYEVVTPLPVFADGYCGSVFCGSLMTGFPENLFQYGKSIKTLAYTFAYTELTTVPKGLFSGLENVTALEDLFYRCSSLTSIPEGLFSGMTKVTSIRRLFYDCTSLTSIPENLFSGMTNVTSLSSPFQGCPITEIPAGLFSGMTKVTSLSLLFQYCSKLTTVPAGLFSGMTKVTDLYGLFSQCSSLTSIPEGLFDGMTEVTNLNGMFWGCSSLTSIPEGLFSGMTKVTSANIMFCSCYKLTSIPKGLFDDLTGVTSASWTFSYCSGLTSIPEGLFRNLTRATDFSYCFYQASASAIHANIFCDEATEKATRFASVTPNFSSCFDGLKGTVAGTAPALWEYTYKSTPTKTKCFNGNSTTTLSNYEDIPTEWIS